MNITKHYRTKHPDSEVLSSRLDPKKAEEAIQESTELGLDEKPEQTLGITRRFSFKCRFCDQEMIAQPSSFYDHISTHTGEYRHICEECGFFASNNKPLRLHYSNMHQRDNYKKAALIGVRVYGYICLDCNFVQMSKKTVENHVNIYHLGEGKKILKIHLSAVDDGAAKKEPVKVAEEKNEELEAEEEEKVIEEPKPKRKKPNEQKKKEVTPKTSPKVKETKKDKEIDMTVFTCNTDIQEEEEKIEQERLKKMDELHESVKTNRQSLNFVDQLSNRLMNDKTPEPEPEAEPEPVTVKTEPVDPEPEIEPTPEPEPIVETTPKKPSKVIEPVSSVEVVQKDNSIIQGMIQKLQGILKEEKSNDGPPPLAPLIEKTYEEKSILSAGFLNVSRSGDDYEYACRVPSCLFSTKNRDRFVAHWNEDHTKINDRFKVTKCRICQIEISSTPDKSLLTNFFAHVENDHLEDLKNMKTLGFVRVRQLPTGWEYACNVPSCLFITKFRDSFAKHCEEDHQDFNKKYKATKCNICKMEIASPELFLKAFFLHVEKKHLNEEENESVAEPLPEALNISEIEAVDDSVRETPPLLRTRRLSGDKLSAAAKEESPELKEEDENPFPFKISGVMSLAEDPVPPLSPIRDKQGPKIESVILKEAKMTPIEKAAVWKSVDALKKFFQCPRELYKCPQFFCKYATSWRHLFEGHVKAHARVNDELVSCVYCDVKTPLSHAGLHIDLRHSNCLYSCSLCLYRALTREYVMVHMKLRHKEVEPIISLPPKSAKTIMMSKQKRHTVAEVCQPYKCGYKGCDAEFLFLNEYIMHNKNKHDSVFKCGHEGCIFHCVLSENMVDHWRSHGSYLFNCLICKVGCMELYTMLEHYSVTHPNMEPSVIDRRQGPEGEKVYGYTNEAFASIKHVNEELLECINASSIVCSNKVEPKTPVTEPPKNVTLVPLSVLQPNSNESKKIIAIIPKSVEALRSNPVQIFTSVSNSAVSSVATTQTVLSVRSSPTFVFASIPSTLPPKVTDKENQQETTTKDDSTTIIEDNDTPTNEPVDAVDPLSLDCEVGNLVSASGDESDSQEVNESSELKNIGLMGYQLYRCAFCDISFSNTKDFKAHTMHSKQCRESNNTVKTFKCVHCRRLFKNPHGLLEHIQYHGQLRFGCSLCVKKFPSTFSLKLHMRSKHNVTNTITTPVVPNKINLERDEFILRPVPVTPEFSKPETSKENSSVQFLSGVKSVYGPDEIDQLPKRYIFNSDIKCALCSYSTKVRTNLVRHLQFHSAEKSVPDIAPVNPVPCLDKNEKMFDKMTNLAISSFNAGSSRMGGGGKQETNKAPKEENTQLPAYVPSHRRYVCCAEGCNYLCPEESQLRHHVYALHVQEPSFTCAHCKTILKTDIECFFKHLKLHDLHLYKCSMCNFIHNLRHKVDKHHADKHPDTPANTITIRSLEAEIVDSEQSAPNAGAATEPVTAPNIKWTKPWHCGMCKYRCAAKNDIITHIFNKHDINTQFKCTLCSYKTNEKDTFDSHFKENHPDNEIDIIHVYYKSEGNGQNLTIQKQFDTTPLWQRDRPRVRHIRGILFEESSSSSQKVTKKSASGRGPNATSVTPSTTPITSVASSPCTSNLDLAIDAVAKGIDETSIMKNAEPRVSKEGEKEDAIIIIDDDDDDDDDDEEASKEGEDVGELMIDVEGVVPGDVKLEVDTSFLNEEILIKKYGNLCGPANKNFKCPLCFKFKTKKISIFVYHLLNELQCMRFKCNLCDFSCITKDNILVHCQEKHTRSPSNYTEKPLEKTLEYWLEILLRYQSKSLIQQSVPSGDVNSSSSAKFQCSYCQRWFRGPWNLKEHELYHWAEHTYTCGHCHMEQVTINELFQHSFISHPRYEVSLISNGPYVGQVLSTLKSPPPMATLTSTATSEDVQYACPYCNEVDKSVEGLHRHISESHEGEDFSIKVLPKTKVEVMYACTECHERGSEEFLKQHHEEKHKGSKFNIYQFICLECSGTFLNIKDLRSHWNKQHVGKKLTYACVESKMSGSTEQYICTKCPFRSCTVGGIRGHLRKHLRPVECGLCGATFIYPTEGRAHHNKEHMHNTAAITENKDKMKDYEEMVQTIVSNQKKGNPASQVASTSTPTPTPTPPPVRKMLARKSTGAPFIRPEVQKEDSDLKKTSTSTE